MAALMEIQPGGALFWIMKKKFRLVNGNTFMGISVEEHIYCFELPQGGLRDCETWRTAPVLVYVYTRSCCRNNKERTDQ